MAIYITFYNDESRAVANELSQTIVDCRLFDNTGKAGGFLESRIIRSVSTIEAPSQELTGVLSWRFPEKCRISIADFVARCEHDVINYTWEGRTEGPMLGPLFNYHPNAKPITKLLWEHLGWAFNESQSVQKIYYNFFICDNALFKRYVNECLAPAMDFLNSTPEIRALANCDSHYGTTRLTVEQRWQQFDLPWYPLHAFICERLIAHWAANNNIKTNHITP